MKCFIENFRELDIDELLAVNGGYGNSSGGGYGKNSGGTGSYGRVTTSSGNQSSWDVWVNNKDGRNSSGEITRPYDPNRDVPRNSGNYDAPSFVSENNLGGDSESDTPLYMQQRDFSSMYGNEFGNTACAATSLLNEISERYTLETGKAMTEEQAIAAMRAAVNAGHIGSTKNGTAYVGNWSEAANAMWETTGLDGSFVVNETATADHIIYALDKDSEKDGAEHFVNSNGDATFYDPYTGETLYVSNYDLEKDRNYRGVDFVK